MIDRLSPSFLTERLEIRLVEARDLPDLLIVNGSEEVARYLPYATWKSLADAESWLVRIAGLHEKGSMRQFVMALRDGGRCVGAICLFNPDVANRRADVGYAVGQADWGRGYGREALDGLLAHAFDDLDLRRVEAFADPRNLASHRLLLSTGFVHEGLMRARSLQKGHAVDSNVYGLLREEFRPRVRVG